jgi:hypothetical protein
MKNKRLIEILENFNPEDEVYIYSGEGDYSLIEIESVEHDPDNYGVNIVIKPYIGD